MTIIHTDTEPRPNITEYPESMRGGSWDHAIYAGSADAAERDARNDAERQGHIVRPHGTFPSWAASRPQRYYDGWRHAWRVLRYRGRCVVCARRTYAFDDGENDPRGVLGDRAAQEVTHEDVPELRPNQYVAACFPCMNEEPSYREALRIARRAALKSAEVPA